MLRLVGGPSVSTLPLTPIEHSCLVSTAVPWTVVWRFMRILRHVCFAVLQAVTTPSVIAFSVVY